MCVLRIVAEDHITVEIFLLPEKQNIGLLCYIVIFNLIFWMILTKRTRNINVGEYCAKTFIRLN